MNMHPIYRARRLRLASLAALLLAVVAFGKFITTGLGAWWLLALMLYGAAIAFGVMLRRAEGGVA